MGKVAISSKSLVVDSGATKTLIKGNNFMKKILNKLKINIKDAVGKIHHSGGHGKLNVKVRDETGNSVELPHLEDVYKLSSLAHNLLSVSAMCRSGCKVIFAKKKSKIITPNGVAIPLHESGGLYFLAIDDNDLDSVHEVRCTSRQRQRATKRAKRVGNPLTSFISKGGKIAHEILDEQLHIANAFQMAKIKISKTKKKIKGIKRDFWNGMGATPGQLNAAKVWHYVHRTLGHPSIEATDKAFRSGIFGKFMNPPEHLKKCAVCANAGFTRPNVKLG